MSGASPEAGQHRGGSRSPGGAFPGRHRTKPGGTVLYRDLLGFGEFRALWSAQVLSYLGEQIAQVAIAILIYVRTGSALLTALAYAVTYLSPIAGGPLLAGLADLIPRRRLMTGIDLVRAALVVCMAVPAVPLYGICTLLFVLVLLGSPHATARTALLPEVLPANRVVQGSAVANITFHASQIVGFLVGGTLVALVGSRHALAVDAVAFTTAALIVLVGVSARPTPDRPTPAHPFWPTLRAGGAIVFGRPELRTLVLLGWLAGFTVVPEGLAAPYARALGGGPLTVGLLMSAMPVGMIGGGLLINWLTDGLAQQRMIGWLAMLSCAPLVLSVARPPLAVLLALWVLGGAGTAYQLSAASVFVRALPGGRTRTQAFMVARSGLLAAQGLGILIAGAVAGHVRPPRVVAYAGMFGLAVATTLAGSWAHHRSALAEQLGDGSDPVEN